MLHAARGLRCDFRISIALFAAFFLAAVTASAQRIPSFVVNISSDSTNGSPANCTDQSLSGAVSDATCSLRDALAASETAGGNVTFSSTVFITSQTIALANGTLNIPSNTSITGPTIGNGPSQTTLVTVTAEDASSPVFSISSGAANDAITGLAISIVPFGSGSCMT